MGKTLLRALALTAVVLGVVGLSTPLRAHANLRTSSPVDGQTVRSAISVVDLVFWSPISDPEIDLVDPQGVEVVGRTTRVDSRTARFEMDPVSVKGTYEVSYAVVSADGDPIAGGLVFTYTSDPSVGLDSRTTTLIVIALIAMFALVRAARHKSAPRH